MNPQFRTLVDVLDFQAKANSEKICAIFPEQGDFSLTYSQLNGKSNKFAELLLSFGVKKGDRVAVYATNIPETLIAYYGILKVGAVLVGIKPLHNLKDVFEVLKESAPKVLVYENQFGKDVLELKRQAKISYLIGLRTKKEKVNLFAEKIESSDRKYVALNKKDPALLIYTSGSMGISKGVLLTHENILSTAQSIVERDFLKTGDRVLCMQPFLYVDQVVFLHSPFLIGGSLVVLDRFSKSKFWSYISKYKVNYANTFPVMLEMLLNPPEKVLKKDILSLRFLFSTGQHLSVQLLDRFEATFGVKLVNGYGLTEATGWSSCNYLDSGRKENSVGTALSCCQQKVIDKLGKDCPLNVVGEIVMKGRNVMSSYYKRPDLTRKVFIKGWLKTGDLGYQDECGFFYVVDRIKSMINKGGEKLAPSEIEDVLLKNKKIAECCVLPVPDKIYGEDIGCFVVLNKNATATEDEIKNFVAKQKGRYYTPKSVFFVNEIPENFSEKFDFNKLKEIIITNHA